LKVLVACEFSGRVRDAFIARGHDAWSCDIEPTEVPGPHYQCDVEEILDFGWDLMIAHPPCTYLAASGARWWKGRETLQYEAAMFAFRLINSGIPKIAMENPRGALSRLLWPPEQEIHPWMFGDFVSKLTCLWLENLPPLIPAYTSRPAGVLNSIHEESPGPNRRKNRSRTFPNVARAMAEQWG
jgi:hypothetical protein